MIDLLDRYQWSALWVVYVLYVAMVFRIFEALR